MPTLLPVADELRRRIAERGPLTFAEFMDAALYWPNGGYYTARRAFGAAGDFYTAPLTHPSFGGLIARQLRQMWQALGRPSPFSVVEAGAGTGRLLADVVAQAEGEVEFATSLSAVAVDRAPAGDAPVDWVRASGLPVRGASGVILANELIDAMPVHRVTLNEGDFREIYVGLDPDGRFLEALGVPSTPALAERLASAGVTLSEGYRAEVNLGLDAWLAEAASAIDRGWVLLIDYGHEAPAYYDESRRRGTLRCYAGHTLGMDPYRNVGRQDISVHVEFTSVMHAAEAAGLTIAGFATQAAFLRGLGFDAWHRQITDRTDLTAPVRLGNLRAMETLVDAEGMGGFRVLVLAKGIDAPLDGFSGKNPVAVDQLAPLATPSHMPFGGVPEPQMPTWEDLLR